MVGDELTTNPLVRGVTFTGSYATGSALYARATADFKRVQLEMGGKNPTIVLDDADLDLAVRIVAVGGFGLTGQSCTATSRVIVEEGIADRFAAALADAARSLRVGDGLEDGIQMGPAGQRRPDARPTSTPCASPSTREPSCSPAGPRPATPPPHPLSASPHRRQPTRHQPATSSPRPCSTMSSVESRLAQEEVFGPVVGILRARDLDDALLKANGVGYGLAASVVTNDLRRAMTFVDRIEAGVVKVNEPTTGLALQAPFGGFKQSSANTFKEQGQAAIEFFTRTKTVYVTYG